MARHPDPAGRTPERRSACAEQGHVSRCDVLDPQLLQAVPRRADGMPQDRYAPGADASETLVHFAPRPSRTRVQLLRLRNYRTFRTRRLVHANLSQASSPAGLCIPVAVQWVFLAGTMDGSSCPGLAGPRAD